MHVTTSHHTRQGLKTNVIPLVDLHNFPLKLVTHCARPPFLSAGSGVKRRSGTQAPVNVQ